MPMKTKFSIPRFIAQAVAAVLLVMVQGQAGPVGTAWTYQGRLHQDALPAQGSYDLRFTLYDAVTHGNVMAGPITNNAVRVDQGLFTVVLDFGDAAFNGEER